MAIFDHQVPSLITPTGEGSRWHEIWQLVISAEAKPAAEQRDFILSSDADAFVIREALAILEGTASLVSHGSSSPASYSDSPGSPLPDERLAPQVGAQFGRYRVGTLLGSGASGSVYSGFDEELNRPVAIKFFAAQRHSASGQRAIPLREARAASALNHPNILVVHEVIETGDSAAIVMEWVSGKTLRALIETNPSIDDILNWGVQLANALAVAHANGLVHGDIKPENVMLRDDGYIKLLDFGLALPAIADVQKGACLTGTPRYLSPEQCLGRAGTSASDIFSFGVMLYELTTGQPPFRGDGMLALLQQIISAEPEPFPSKAPRLPRDVVKLIGEMLAKEPRNRPTAALVASRLTAIRAHLAAARPLLRRRRLQAAAGVAAVGTIAFILFTREPRAGIDLSRMAVHPLASQPGLESNPSISPDGKWISCLYKERPKDKAKLQVHAMQGATPTVIDTGDLIVEQSAAWSPDSTNLAFVGLDSSGIRSIYRTGRSGGTLTKLTSCTRSSGCDFDWSPDGRSLALTDKTPTDGGEALFLVDIATNKRRQLLKLPQRVSSPRYSPDGKWIAFSRHASFTRYDICVVRSNGGTHQCLNHFPIWVNSFSWSQDNRSVIAIAGLRTLRLEMWQFPVEGKSEPRRVTAFDVGGIREITIARERGSIAWVRDLSSSSIWRMPLEGAGDAPEQLVSSAALDSDPEWSSNGRMVFCSNRSGAAEIWIARSDGSGQTQATRSRGMFVGDPHWSPDGRHVAFTAHQDENADIFTMSCEGGDAQPCSAPTQLTRLPSSEANPTWSIDGKWIYFSSDRTGSFEVWRVPSSGGESQRVTWNGGYVARESADGQWLYYSKESRGNGFWRVPLPAGDPGQKEEAIVSRSPYKAGATWALGLDKLYYYPSQEDAPNALPSIRVVDLQNRQAHDLALGNVQLSRGLSLSQDGRSLLRTQKDRAVSVIMIAE